MVSCVINVTPIPVVPAWDFAAIATIERRGLMMKINLKPVILLCLVSVAVLSLAACDQRKPNPTLPGAHPDSWMVQSSADFHGAVVLATGLTGCSSCHGQDYTGGKSGIACTDCHGVGNSNCTACHGGIDNSTGAPPLGLRGETDDTSVAVGAHTIHMEGAVLASGVPCSTCHIVPLFAWEPAHFDFDISQGGGVSDSIAEVTIQGIGSGLGAAWNRTTRSCDNIYCHGNFSGGSQDNAPVWTDENQALCGSCHDIGDNPGDLLWKHEFHITVAGLACADCHAGIVDSSLNILALDLHVNGSVDTAIADTSLCFDCHGPGTSSCTYCHGGTDNQTGAPPVGLRSETSTTALAVGAHTRHIAGGAISDGVSCSECHSVPESVFTPNHLGADSIAEMSWGSLAGGPVTWNRTGATCAGTYCHGNFSGGYANNQPVWTGENQAACGTCHDDGNTPQFLTGLHKKHDEEGIDCYRCHAATVNASLTVIGKQVHIDGQKTVSFSSGSGTFSNGRCSNIVCHESKPWSGGGDKNRRRP